mgnify:CR=1 FL=1
MGMGPGPAATARNKANKRETEFLLKDPKGYTAEKMAIRKLALVCTIRAG